MLLACALAPRMKVATPPTGLTTRHLVVLGSVAGVGFTMAIFIAQLAFTSPTLLAAAKMGVLIASALASVFALRARPCVARPRRERRGADGG